MDGPFASRAYLTSPGELAGMAAKVLRANDTGTLVTASPRQYPHMWSWDAAFVAVGLAHLDPVRALTELDTLFAAQWRDGMVPHIVFTADADYFPGPDRWGTEAAEHRAEGVRTSGICQPPVHAVALRRVLDVAGGTDRGGYVADGVRRLWPSLFAWHHWLARHRMPDPCGLVAIVHGWESGMDDSPRWDVPYAAVLPGDDPPPYDRHLCLVEQMRRVGYRPDDVVRESSFLGGDVFTTAVFGLACQVLAELGLELDCGAEEEIDALHRWARGARAAVAATCHPDSGLARDRDLRGGTWLESDTIAGFAPLLCGGAPVSVELRLLAELGGSRWAGHPALAAGVLPSVSPLAPCFDARQDWRGPQWPVLAWLFGWAFERRGWARRAGRIRAEGLALTSDGRFGGRYEPFTGEPLGSHDQSWTAAVVLDWVGDLRFT